MGRTYVNTNIKLKSGGGIVNEANGLEITSIPAGSDGSGLINIFRSSDTFKTISSSNLRHTNPDGGGNTQSTTPVKKKEILYNDVNGTLKVSFTLALDYSGSAYAYARIYKNGVAFGTQRQVIGSSGNPSTFTEDLVFATGDLIQLYVWVSSASWTATVTGFTLSYDKVPNTIASTNNL